MMWDKKGEGPVETSRGSDDKPLNTDVKKWRRMGGEGTRAMGHIIKRN